MSGCWLVGPSLLSKLRQLEVSYTSRQLSEHLFCLSLRLKVNWKRGEALRDKGARLVLQKLQGNLNRLIDKQEDRKIDR